MSAIERKIKKLQLEGEGSRVRTESVSNVNLPGVLDFTYNEPEKDEIADDLYTRLREPATPGPSDMCHQMKKRKKRAPKSRLAAKCQLQVEKDIASGSQKKISDIWLLKKEEE